MNEDLTHALRSAQTPLPNLETLQDCKNLIGVGCDVIEIERVRGTIERQGARFLERVFTQAERDYCAQMRDPAPHFAARFAVKEAVAKAFGVGIGAEFGWLTVSVAHDTKGAPIAILDAQGRDLLTRFGGDKILLSLSHSQTVAIAIAGITRTSAP